MPVSVPWSQPVQYKFFVDGMTWVSTTPANPPTPNDPNNPNGNSIDAPITCPASFTCATPAVPPAGVFDWRDAVVYFVFVDRFFDGDPSNNCNVKGSQTTPYTSTNYLGGDWAGVTQKITGGYFTDLGVNTLWITVPIKNADDVADEGTNGDTHMYSAYHGYWPKDPTTTESCFGSAADLKAMVTAAHAKNIKVLFDYAMVHVHTESSVYTQHQNDSPPWFTPNCICGAQGCGNYDTSCWFAPYLAHWDYTNAAARSYSIDAAIQLIQQNGNDAFRLDAIKQVDPSWLNALRPAVTSQILAGEMPQQRFYMVGETYDFQNRGLIKSLIDPATKLDGQFDFPLRIRLVEVLLMRSTQNLLTPDDLSWSRNAPPGFTGLSQFMDSNDTYYPTDAVMSTFIGNHDLPRSIHYAEQTLPGWLSAGSPSNPSAAKSGKDCRPVPGRTSRSSRPTPTLTSAWPPPSPSSSPTRARRSSTTATRSACPARATPTTAARCSGPATAPPSRASTIASPRSPPCAPRTLPCAAAPAPPSRSRRTCGSTCSRPSPATPWPTPCTSPSTGATATSRRPRSLRG